MCAALGLSNVERGDVHAIQEHTNRQIIGEWYKSWRVVQVS